MGLLVDGSDGTADMHCYRGRVIIPKAWFRAYP